MLNPLRDVSSLMPEQADQKIKKKKKSVIDIITVHDSGV